MLPYPLRVHQKDALANLARFSVLVWHRRGGKTVFAVKRLASAALKTQLSAGRFGYIAPLYRQAKAVAWDYLKAILRDVPGVTFNESELQAELGNGATIRLFGADNPDSLRGLYFDGVVLDEVAQMRPQVWGEIVRPALADREGWALFIGTPKGTNLFSELFYRSTSGSESDWYGEIRRATDTGAISPEELDRAKREMTPSQWAQEMECDFSAAVENALVDLNTVLEAQRRQLPPEEHAQEAVVLGVDVARYGDDRSVVAVRQGRRCFPFRVWRGLDLMTLAGNVARVMDELKPHATFVDQTGIGSGVVDRLRQLGRRVVGVEFGGTPYSEGVGGAQFLNRRAEMWWAMAEWVKTGQLPATPELIGELTAPTYSFGNAAGRLQLESKEDMKKRGLPSPDLADALALTFAEPVHAPGLRRGPPVSIRAFGASR
ncbi:MAG: terminase [Betaproteobacteria bacterium]|nr:terminase [Betaproteobacteria bacterium]